MASEDYYGGYDGGQSGGYAGSRGPASRKDDDKRKIFVGGLSWETTQAEMEAYFSKFGEVIDCTLKEDPNTRKSRGFGFVLFGDVGTVDKVIGQETHTLNGRTISPQRVRAKGQSSERTKKVFVGGVDPELSETDIRSYFSEFGPIEDVHLPYDKMKQSRRGFVFITFESEDTVEKVVEQPRQVLGGKEVDVKKATPKESRGGGGGGGYGGGYGGGGYGGYSGGGGGGYGGYGGYDQGYGDSGWGRYGQGGGGSGGYSGSGYGSGGGGGGGNYGGGWGGQDNYGNYSSGGSGNDYYNQGGYGGY